MRQRRTKTAKPRSRREFAGKPNRELAAQTRKILRRHYAAKYRVR
jgi:hypothetical protein